MRPERLVALLNFVTTCQLGVPERATVEGRVVRVRDCGRVLRSMLSYRSEQLAEFSVMQALFDIAHGNDRQIDPCLLGIIPQTLPMLIPE